MITTLLIIHTIIAALMIVIVLFQKNEGGGLGMGGSTMGGLMSSRGTANLLTRTTAVLATLFFVSTLGLALIFKGSSRTKSILNDTEITLPSTAPLPPKSSVPLTALPSSGAPAQETKTPVHPHPSSK